MCEKNYIWNPSTCISENGIYLESIINDSVITCDKSIEVVWSEPINFNNKKATCKMDNFYNLLAFF